MSKKLTEQELNDLVYSGLALLKCKICGKVLKKENVVHKDFLLNPLRVMFLHVLSHGSITEKEISKSIIIVPRKRRESREMVMKKRKEIVLASPLETFDDFFQAIGKAVRKRRK